MAVSDKSRTWDGAIVAYFKTHVAFALRRTSGTRRVMVVTDVSGQSVAHIFRGQVVQEDCLEHLGTQLYKNGAHHCPETSVTTILRCVKSPKNEDLIHTAVEA
jgi:hypothetical protein